MEVLGVGEAADDKVRVLSPCPKGAYGGEL
jgi:hypothetical protein